MDRLEQMSIGVAGDGMGGTVAPTFTFIIGSGHQMLKVVPPGEPVSLSIREWLAAADISDLDAESTNCLAAGPGGKSALLKSEDDVSSSPSGG